MLGTSAKSIKHYINSSYYKVTLIIAFTVFLLKTVVFGD